MILDGLPENVKPLIQIIDDWNSNRRLALAFEAKVGKGTLLIVSTDLKTDLEKRAVARQLRYSFEKYMAGFEFDPQNQVDPDAIAQLFKKPSVMSDAKVQYFNSEVRGFEASNAIDEDPGTFWHTAWEGDIPGYPHELQIDLGKELEIRGFKLLPRQDGISGGWISKVELFVSNDGKDWNQPVATAALPQGKDEKRIDLDKVYHARFIRLVALKGFAGQEFASLAEIGVITSKDQK
jgi:hypothetical protein